ncbi:hypothetical protein PGT21_015736 [Puccinia graminis f. sp. tritici]|uniref:Uncharacterized protein n=1 Tax=Puccinia graminis f. sp. tritici TaxID=56615 RepID=A0A5B0LM84_PUCGR|nr:hypothetical protein PGTUg99_021449 [Puccinia graminis f. sp. tritici]KAA1090854.1 hypothetical protein PGT21_015736 [Puccinia graminis f. sp. tritici]
MLLYPVSVAWLYTPQQAHVLATLLGTLSISLPGCGTLRTVVKQSKDDLASPQQCGWWEKSFAWPTVGHSGPSGRPCCVSPLPVGRHFRTLLQAG